jgi:hypothetical protein
LAWYDADGPTVPANDESPSRRVVAREKQKESASAPSATAVFAAPFPLYRTRWGTGKAMYRVDANRVSASTMIVGAHTRAARLIWNG